MLKTILVTGGAGFIGGNFVLMQRRHGISRIVNLDKLTYAGNLETLASLEGDPDHIFVQGDIGDRSLLERIFQEHQPEAIVNFAAETHVDRSIDSPEAFVQTNVLGTFNLLESARGYWRQLSDSQKQAFRFLHISTDEVFGTLEAEDPKFSETTPYAPNSPYSASKASSDHLVRSYFHTYQLPTLITNCSNNYGPYQFPEKLIPLMILNAIEGKSLPIYGDGKNIRDWLFVEDHCRAIQLVLEKGKIGQTYNVGGNSEYDNVWIVNKVCEILDQKLSDSKYRPHANLIQFVKDRPGHDRRYAIDFSKLSQELQWMPQESIETGLEKTVQWYLDNADWCQQVTHKKYGRERLGVES